MNDYEQKKEQKEGENRKMESARRMRKFFKTLLLWFIPVVVSGGFIWFLVKTTPNPDLTGDLNSCIQHTNVGMHIHSDLTIVIDGQDQEIPANTGVSPVCMRPIHTHDSTGKIHIEFKQARDAKLGEFFEVWGKSFSSNNIFEYYNSDNKKVKLLVNGAENLEFENYIMKDGDEIEIRYE